MARQAVLGLPCANKGFSVRVLYQKAMISGSKIAMKNGLLYHYQSH